MAWGIVVFACWARPEFVTFAASVEVGISSGMISTLEAITGSWTITVIAKIVSMSIIVASAHWMAWAVICVTVVSVESFFTLTVSFEVTLRVVVTFDTVLTSWASTAITMVTDWVASFHVETYTTVISGPEFVADAS